MADECLLYLGLAKFDLSIPSDREKVRASLTRLFDREIGNLRQPLERATSMAVEHVLRLWGDLNYQARREQRKKDSSERKLTRQIAEREKVKQERLDYKLRKAGGPVQ